MKIFRKLVLATRKAPTAALIAAVVVPGGLIVLGAVITANEVYKSIKKK